MDTVPQGLEDNLFDVLLDVINSSLAKVFYFNIGFGIPFITSIAITAYVVCNLYLKFPALRLFKHSLSVIRGKYNNPQDPGVTTHGQAIATAALGTVGLGSVAGVSMAVVIGGPGAIFWMIIAGIFGMSIKYIEVFLGHRFRDFSSDGTISGGPFYYLRDGLQSIGCPGFICKFLAVYYAFCLFLNSWGSANLFQANQTAITLAQTFSVFSNHRVLLAFFLAACVMTTVFGDVKVIARVASTLVPFMTCFYVFGCLAVLFVCRHEILNAIVLIFTDAFTSSAARGGCAGTITCAFISGFNRLVFSTEAGGGTSAVAHASTKSSESIRTATAAFVELLICLFVAVMTGLVIVSSGVYEGADPRMSGAALTNMAFQKVHPMFSFFLAVSVFFIAMTTVMGWSYYNTVSWTFVFGDRLHLLRKILYVSITVAGAMINNAEKVVTFCDFTWIMAVIPNAVCLVLLLPFVKREEIDYCKRMGLGRFKKLSNK